MIENGRIKTEREFFIEFGEDWRDYVGWYNGMDELFGVEFNETNYIKNGDLKIFRWYISECFIKQTTIINYNDKKVLVYD